MKPADGDEDEQVKEKKPKAKKGRKERGKAGRNKGNAHGAGDKDYEYFLQDIEEDKEFRSHMNLYKDDENMADLMSRMDKMTLEKDKKEIKKIPRKTEEGKKKEFEN